MDPAQLLASFKVCCPKMIFLRQKLFCENLVLSIYLAASFSEFPRTNGDGPTGLFNAAAGRIYPAE